MYIFFQLFSNHLLLVHEQALWLLLLLGSSSSILFSANMIMPLLPQLSCLLLLLASIQIAQSYIPVNVEYPTLSSSSASVSESADQSSSSYSSQGNYAVKCQGAIQGFSAVDTNCNPCLTYSLSSLLLLLLLLLQSEK